MLDVAAGNGLNLAYYPPGRAVAVVDLSLAMMNVAQRRLARPDDDKLAAAFNRLSRDCRGDVSRVTNMLRCAG